MTQQVYSIFRNPFTVVKFVYAENQAGADAQAGSGETAYLGVPEWDGSDWVLDDGEGGQLAVGYPSPPPFRTEEDDFRQVRAERNRRLLMTDWTQLPDVPITVTSQGAFASYRQQLRDIPAGHAYGAQVAWPQEPDYVKT